MYYQLIFIYDTNWLYILFADFISFADIFLLFYEQLKLWNAKK